MSHIASTRRRGAVAGIVAIMAMALFVAIAPVGTLAQDMLNRFRVQQFAAITIPMDLVEGMSSQMQNVDPAVKDQAEAAAQALGSFSTTFERGSFHQAASLDEANAQLNGSLSVPSTLPDAFASAQPQAYYSDPGTAAYALNVEQARGLLSTLGLSASALPDPSQEPTVTISADVPAAAALVYEADGKYLVAGQFVSPGPSLNIPSSVDVNLLREEVLALPGLPADIVAQLRNVKDWEKTLIVPVPSGATSRQVTVDGAAGLLVESDQGAVVLWQKDGALYAVGGQSVSGDDALRVAESM